MPIPVARLMIITALLVIFSTAGCTRAPGVDGPPTENAGEEGVTGETDPNRVASTAGSGAIQILYRLDPRLTSGIYMGERWVSPPIYDIVVDQVPYTVEARAEVVDGNGRAVQTTTELAPENPEMLAVTPGEDGTIKITIRRSGKSNLQVTAGGLASTLSIQATEQNGGLRLTISEQ